jgi:hypothetical protein
MISMDIPGYPGSAGAGQVMIYGQTGAHFGGTRGMGDVEHFVDG